MTDQRTLKKIIVEQKEKIEKLENQIKTVEAVLKDYYFPQIFRDGRRGVRDKCGKEPCAACYIDQDICLQKHRLFERISIALDYQQQSVNSKESHDGRGVSERAQTRKSLNCRNDETPITQSVGKISTKGGKE